MPARQLEEFVLTERAAAGPEASRKDARPAPAELLRLVLASLEDDKAEDVVQVDLQGKSEIADYMVICTGRSTRQVASISEKLLERLKHEANVYARAEGMEAADWVLIDAGDVIVHVFRPEVRDFYQLEKMWLPAPQAGARAAAMA